MTLTPVEPAGIDAAGKVSLWWFPAIVDLKNPTLAELGAGVNLSLIVYDWDPNGTQGSTERSHYGSASVGTSLGRNKYDPAEILYDYDPQDVDGAEDEYEHYSTLIPGLTGVLGDRRGLTPDVAPAAGQVWDLFPAQLGARNRVAVQASEEGAKLRVRQKIAIVGDVEQDVVIEAPAGP